MGNITVRNISRSNLTFALQGCNCEAKRPGEIWYTKFLLFRSHGVKSNAYSYMIAGWDPIFEYQGKTYAEMDKEAKVRKTKCGPCFLCCGALTIQTEPDLPPIQGLDEVSAVACQETRLM